MTTAALNIEATPKSMVTERHVQFATKAGRTNRFECVSKLLNRCDEKTSELQFGMTDVQLANSAF